MWEGSGSPRERYTGERQGEQGNPKNGTIIRSKGPIRFKEMCKRAYINL